VLASRQQFELQEVAELLQRNYHYKIISNNRFQEYNLLGCDVTKNETYSQSKFLQFITDIVCCVASTDETINISSTT
jgi:hypothetical protein